MMKQIKHVFLFELRSILTKKSVIVTTLIISMVFLIGTTIPTVVSMFDSTPDIVDEPDPNDVLPSLGNAGILISTSDIDQESFLAMIDDYSLYTSIDKMRTDVQERVIPEGFIIQSATSVSAIMLDRDWMSYNGQMITSMLRSIQINKNLEALELQPGLIYDAMAVEIDYEETVLGRDSGSTFLLSFILMFAVYMLVIMYGSFVSTSVAREKDNRTMEILITSTKPSTLIIGKVFANGVAGLTQFGFVAIIGLVGFFINRANYPSFIIDTISGGFTWDGILIFLLFTILGYLLYLFIYASLGSLVSKIEDVSSSIAPITLLFMVAYFVSAFGMEAPGSMIVRVGSFVPFTSILAMPIRYFQMSIMWYEIAISIVIMILTTALFATISIRIYRMGSLNYGNKIGLIKALKMIAQENKG